MNKLGNSTAPSRIILLGQNLQQAEIEADGFKLLEEKKLLQALAKVDFDESSLIKNIEETVNPKAARFKTILGYVLSVIGMSMVVSVLALNIRQPSTTIIAMTLPILGFILIQYRVTADYLNREISQHDYQQVAMVAKYNPAVRVYAKEQLEKHQMLRLEDYFYLRIGRQYEKVERFLSKGLDSKRQAIEEIIGDKHNEA